MLYVNGVDEIILYKQNNTTLLHLLLKTARNTANDK